MTRSVFKSILLITLLLASLAPCAAQRKRKAKSRVVSKPAAPRVVEEIPQAWKEFAPPEGLFSIEFPGDPRPSDASGNPNVHDFALTTTTAIYGAGYLDFAKSDDADEAEFASKLIEDTTKQMTAVADTTLDRQTDMLLDSHPGRELRLRLPEDSIYIDRMYVVGARLYQLSIAIKGYYANPQKKGFHDWMIAKFFESFKLK
ncbi:MAG: hypothetical protein JOZ52_02495 [Acidobacteria bacterium]|nr:hypothetical protein [Acidobacteriota bacterium]